MAAIRSGETRTMKRAAIATTSATTSQPTASHRGRATLADVSEKSHPKRRHGNRHEEAGAAAPERQLAEAVLQEPVEVAGTLGLRSQGTQSAKPEQRDRDRRDQKRRVPRIEIGVTLAGAAVKLHEELAAKREDGA